MSKIFNSIPIFHGNRGDDLTLWLKQIETAFVLDETPFDLSTDMAVVKLSGTAGNWYSNNRELWKSWQEFKRAMQARFQALKSSRSLWITLLQMKQGNQAIREYVDLYYCKYNEYLRSWRMEQENNGGTIDPKGIEPSTEIKAMLRDAFVSGLNERIRYIIIQAKPDSLEKAVNSALNLMGNDLKSIQHQEVIDEDGDVEIGMAELANEISSLKIMLANRGGMTEKRRDGCYCQALGA